MRSKCIIIIIFFCILYIVKIFSEYRRIVIMYLSAAIIYSRYKLELQTPKYIHNIYSTVIGSQPVQNARAFSIIHFITHIIFKWHMIIYVSITIYSA